MNSPLDPKTHASISSFLNEVIRAAGYVPAERREDLRRELQSHIESLVEEYQALGMTESEALESTLSKMGSAMTVGASYGRAWRRSHWRELFWPAYAGFVLVYSAICLIGMALLNLFHLPSHAAWPSPNIIWFLIGGMGISFLAGWIAGAVFPKQGVRAAKAVCLTYFFLYMPIAQLVTNHGPLTPGLQHTPLLLAIPIYFLWVWLTNIFTLLLLLPPSILGAKAASRRPRSGKAVLG